MPFISIQENGTPKQYSVTKPLSFGRSADNDIVMKEGMASRKHFKVVPRDGACILEDLGSRNGTFVNGVRVDGTHTLQDGDKIHVGSTSMIFALGETPAAEAPAPAAPPRERPKSRAQTRIEPREESQPSTRSHLDADGPMLVNVSDPKQIFALTDGKTTFGRRGECTHTLRVDGLSGVHCAIEARGGSFILSDEGSTNGTLHNRKRIDAPVKLDVGDQVQIGSFKGMFFDPSAGVALESLLARADLQKVAADQEYEVVARSARSKSNTVPIALLSVGGLALLIFLAVLAMPEPETQRPPAEIPGNLLAGTMSFESQEDLDRWDMNDLHGAAITLDNAVAASGKASLMIRLGGAAPSVLVSKNGGAATGGSCYGIQWKARADGLNGELSARLRWQLHDGSDTLSLGPALKGSTSEAFVQINSDALIAPPGAKSWQLELVSSGGSGTVWVDDVAVVSVPAPGYTGLVDGPIAAYAAETGVATLYRGKEILLRDLQAVVTQGQDSAAQSAAAMDRSREDRSAFSATVSGTLRWSREGSIPFQTHLARGADETLIYSFRLLGALPQGADLGFITRVRADASLPDNGDSGEFVWALGGHQILLRSSLPLALKSEGPGENNTQWLRLQPETAALRDAGEWSLEFRPIPADTVLRINELRSRLDKLDRPDWQPELGPGWESAVKGAQLGVAYNDYKSIKTDFWFMRNDAARAKKRMAQIESMLNDLWTSAEASYKEAMQFNIYEDYQMALDRFNLIQALFEGMEPERSDLLRSLRAVPGHILELQSALSARRSERIKKDAKRLLDLAEQERKGSHAAAARAFCQEILKRYPDTEWAERANSLLKDLGD